MEQKQATQIFEALSSSIRLDIFKLLVKYIPDGLVAGRIAELLDIPANNLSFHLKELLNSRLVTAEQEGRFQRYRADVSIMLEVIGYLTAECCSGAGGENCFEIVGKKVKNR